jgi:hypothetical protein
MRLFLQAILGLFVAVALTGVVQATVIGQHVGSTDPTTEGFSLDGTAGTGVDDSGTAAWKEDTTWGRYGKSISSGQASDMATNGWVAQQTVRMGVAGLDPNSNRPGTASKWLVGLGLMEVSPTDSGPGTYSLCLGTDTSGNPTVWQWDENYTASATLTQIGTVTGTGYHTYKLVQQPGVGTANLYVDNSLMAAITPVAGFGAARYMIGNTASSAYTDPVGVYIAGASLSTGIPTPEPCAFVLICTGMLGLLAYAWRRRR